MKKDCVVSGLLELLWAALFDLLISTECAREPFFFFILSPLFSFISFFTHPLSILCPALPFQALIFYFTSHPFFIRLPIFLLVQGSSPPRQLFPPLLSLSLFKQVQANFTLDRREKEERPNSITNNKQQQRAGGADVSSLCKTSDFICNHCQGSNSNNTPACHHTGSQATALTVYTCDNQRKVVITVLFN
jgi:hypothetical protein